MARGGHTLQRVRSVVGQTGIVGPFLVLFVVLAVSSKPFLTKNNLLQLFDQQSTTLIVAAATTLVLISGGVDLSIAQVTTSAQIEVARQQTETAAALEAALAHRAALDAGGAVDPIAMLRATGQLPELTVVRDDAERRTA